MNMRKITSMTMVWSLIILILNSIVLYVVPEGRVAYWADWRFLGLTKSQWGSQHTTVGFLFLFAGILHIYFNWNPIVAYMKNKAKQLKVFTPPSTIGFALTVIFVVGTYLNVPPMSTIVDISDSFKQAASLKYGEPPYGHAELSSLKMFARKEGLNLDQSIEMLTAAGIPVSGPEMTIKEIAGISERSPQQVYEIIKTAGGTTSVAARLPEGKMFPDAPRPGWGKNKLTTVCQDYDLQVGQIIAELAALQITAKPDDTIKEIAAANNMEPMGLFEVLHEIVAAKR